MSLIPRPIEWAHPAPPIPICLRVSRLRKKINGLIKLKRLSSYIEDLSIATRTEQSKELDEIKSDLNRIVWSGCAFPVLEAIEHYFRHKLFLKGSKIENTVFQTTWTAYRAPLNDYASEDVKILNNKDLFVKFLQNHNIPVVCDYGYITSEDGEILWAGTDNQPCGTLRDLLVKHSVVFCKPIDASQGKGCMRLDWADRNNLSIDGKICSFEDFASVLKGKNIVQQYVVQHPVMSAVHKNSVNTIRILTMRDTEGQPHYVAGKVRFGSGGKSVDNFHGGGVATGIDFARQCCRATALSGDLKAAPKKQHPDTGVVFDGYKLPYFPEIIDLCVKTHKCFPKIHGIGWDVAVTENGPLFIEANATYDPMLLPVLNPDWGDPAGKYLIPCYNQLMKKHDYQ